MKVRVGSVLVEIVLLKNCSFIAKLIDLQKSACSLSCINPTRIPSLFVVESSLHHVLLSKLSEAAGKEENNSTTPSSSVVNDDNVLISETGWKTQNIHTELIYRLNPKRNIGQAYRNFGANVSDHGNHVLCVCCDGVQSIEEYVKSNFANQEEMKDLEFISDEKQIEDYLKNNVDVQTINKLFNFSKEEIAKYSVELNMVAYLAVRDFN